MRPATFAYSATKAGVLGLTKGLARELAPSICVNAVCPGPIRAFANTAQKVKDTLDAWIGSVGPQGPQRTSASG